MNATKVSLLVSVILCFALAGAGCGDDDGGGSNNTNSMPDAATGSDGSTGTDGSTAGDGGSGPWDCSAIGLCAADCGSDFGCINDCRANGCQSADDAYGEVQDCVIANCMFDCASDPQGQACQDCRNTNCSTQITACEANTCP